MSVLVVRLVRLLQRHQKNSTPHFSFRKLGKYLYAYKYRCWPGAKVPAGFIEMVKWILTKPAMTGFSKFCETLPLTSEVGEGIYTWALSPGKFLLAVSISQQILNTSNSSGNVNKPFKRINEYKYIQRDITGHLSFMESQSSLSFAIWSRFWTESKSERFHLVLPHVCFPIWNSVKSLSLSFIEPKAMSWTGFRLWLLAPEQQSCEYWIQVLKSPPKLGAKQGFFYQLQGSCMAA